MTSWAMFCRALVSLTDSQLADAGDMLEGERERRAAAKAKANGRRRAAPAVAVSESTPGHADTGTRRARSGPLVPPFGANDAPLTARGRALMCAIRAECGPLQVTGARQLTAYALMDRGLIVQALIVGAFWVELTAAGRAWKDPGRK